MVANSGFQMGGTSCVWYLLSAPLWLMLIPIIKTPSWIMMRLTIGLVLVICQALDIITAITFPEKLIFDYVTNMLD